MNMKQAIAVLTAAQQEARTITTHQKMVGLYARTLNGLVKAGWSRNAAVLRARDVTLATLKTPA